MAAKRAAKMKEIQEENRRLAKEKRDRENAWRQDQERKNKFEITNINGSDLMQENAATTVSQLAEHRYVPYHFKGLNPQQKAEIEAQRAQQVRENQYAKQMQSEEEKMWAMQ